MNEMERQQFTFYASYFEAATMLPDKERLAFYDAITAYALHGIKPDLDGIVAAAFILTKPTLDTGRRKAKSGHKGGSKTEATTKQNGSNNEAKRKQTANNDEATNKQTASEKEVEKEREVEIEYESKKKIKKEKADAFVEFADGDTELLDALKEFEAMRNKIKKPMVGNAKMRLINKLKSDFPRDQWIAVLNQSTDSCWASVFPPHGQYQKQRPPALSAMDNLRDLYKQYSSGEG